MQAETTYMAEEDKPAAPKSDQAEQAVEGKPAAPKSDQSEQPADADSQQATKPGRRRSKYSHHTLFDIPIGGLSEAVAKAVAAAAATAAGEEEEPEFQPGVERDALGVVARVTYPDYSTREFVHNAGEVSEMVLRDRDGKATARWSRREDGFTEHKLDGKGEAESAGRLWRGQITVDNTTGDITFRPAHSSLVITERAEDGMAVSENKKDQWAVSRGRDGRVSRVDYPGGGFRVFDYDGKGLAKITEGDEVTYTRQIDGSWLKLDTSTNSSELCQERFLVNERGDTVFVGPGYQVSQRPDGTRIGCEVDRQGRLLVKVVSHPIEGEYQFGYDDDGRLRAVAWPDGSADTRLGPNRWRREPPGEDLDLDQQVDLDGNLIAISTTGVVEVIRPDGSARIEYPNGTREEHDRGGMMAWKITPAQREIRLNTEAGRYEYETRDHEMLSEIARDHLRAIDGTAKYEPSRDEVTKEVQRLAKINQLQESSLLEKGTRLALYEQAVTVTSADQ